LVEALGDEVIISSVSSDDKILGASLVFVTPSQIHDYFVLAKSEAFSEGLPSLLFMNMIEQAFSYGKETVNCGPSAPWDGSFEFKRRFGASPVPVYAYLMNGTLMEKYLFYIKRRIKRKKTHAALARQAA
jgi:hypothetical protein